MYDGMLLERELESRYKGQDEADLNDVALHEAYCTPGRRLVTRAGAGGMMLPRYGRQRRPRIDLRGGGTDEFSAQSTSECSSSVSDLTIHRLPRP